MAARLNSNERSTDERRQLNSRVFVSLSCAITDQILVSHRAPPRPPRPALLLVLMSDAHLSSAHYSRELLDIVDADWAASSLSDDDLYLPESAHADVHQTDADSEDASAVLTDAQGVTWSMSLASNTVATSSSSGGGGGGGVRPPLNAAAAAASASLSLVGGVGVGGPHSAVESADGLRWTDLGLQGFAASAARQPLQ